VKPLVSVVMPVLNPHPAYFAEAVESIRRQTLTDWELVIVEAPGETSAATTLSRIDDPRIRHIQVESPTSLVEQRNRGLHESRADLIAMLDADDVAEPCRLELQAARFSGDLALHVLGTQLTIIAPDNETLGSRRYPTTHETILAALPRYNPIAQPSVMFRRQTVLDAGGYQYRQHPAVEDYELWSRLARLGCRLENMTESLVRYRIHPGASKSEKLHGILRGTIDIKRMHWSDRLGIRGRMRIWAESAMLALPPSWVMRLFLLTTVRRSQVPASAAARS
jgi:glycosyltransferase involved in cell wall biosynthesis